jgi:hypothetical protein
MSSHVVTLTISPHDGGQAKKAQIATLFERLARKEAAQRLLGAMGLDPRQFVVFLELFRTLSEREEMVGSVGVRRFNISYAAIIAAGLGLFPWLALAGAIADSKTPRFPGSGALPESIFLLFLLFLTFAFTFLVIIREAASALFNPVEASMLSHSPIHSPTYAAAKIAHILIAVIYLVLGLNVYPALLEGLFLFIRKYPGGRWFLPITHIASAALIGVWTAFIICAFYGLLKRIVPVSLLKSVSGWIQLLTMGTLVVVLLFYPQWFLLSFLGKIVTAQFETGQWTWMPLSWFAEIGRLGCLGCTWRLGWQGVWSIIASVIVIGFSLRSFSGTYLLKAASTIQSLRWKSRGGGAISRLSAAIACAVTRSPIGVGIFCFVGKMIRRDWMFRRAILKQAWIPLIAIIGIIIGIYRFGIPSVIPKNDAATIFFPHLLAVIAMALCINLPTTVFSKGAWIYLTAPIGSVRPVAKAIFWALWMVSAGLPNFILMLFFMRFLSWEESVFIAAFNLIVISLYLAFEIRLISGLPFSTQENESRTMTNSIYVQVCYLAAVMVPAMAHQSLCEHLWIGLLAALGLLAVTIYVLHVNLGKLEREILWRLYEMKMGSNQMFREFE